MVRPRKHLAVVVVSNQGHDIPAEDVHPPVADHCPDTVPQVVLVALSERSISDSADYLSTMFTSPTSHRLRTALLALFVIVSLVGAACSSSSASSDDLPDLEDVPGAEASSEGADAAPDFTIMTLDGAGFILSEHLEDDGRPVFLNMWASWCPPCRQEMPDIDAASESHEDVKFVGIAVNDDPVEAAGFATSIDIGYTIGFDEQGVVAQEYKVVGLPASYIISSDGVILEKIFGSVTEDDIDAMLARWFS